MSLIPPKPLAVLLITLYSLLLVTACSNLPVPTTMPEDTSSAIIGKWRFKGLGDSIMGGTPVPTDSPELAEINSDLSEAVIEYQFFKDGTAIFQYNEEGQASLSDIGTYKLLADGTMIDITLPESEDNTPMLGLRRLADSSILRFTVAIQNNQLTLQSSMGESFSMKYNFEKVE